MLVHPVYSVYSVLRTYAVAQYYGCFRQPNFWGATGFKWERLIAREQRGGGPAQNEILMDYEGQIEE